MKTLIIIPAYNEAEHIAQVVGEIKAAAPQADCLVVNDYSRDATQQVCMERGLSFVSLPLNLGIGGGVQTGYLYALDGGYDIAVQMDGDGQHDPAHLEKLIAPIQQGEAEVVIGSRFLTGEGFQSSRLRRFGIRFLSGLIRLCSGIRVRDVTSGFRAVNRRFMEIYARDYAQDYPEPEAIIAAAMFGGRVKEVPVVMRERAGGESSIKRWKTVYYMLKVSLAIALYRLTFRKEKKR